MAPRPTRIGVSSINACQREVLHALRVKNTTKKARFRQRCFPSLWQHRDILFNSYWWALFQIGQHANQPVPGYQSHNYFNPAVFSPVYNGGCSCYAQWSNNKKIIMKLDSRWRAGCYCRQGGSIFATKSITNDVFKMLQRKQWMWGLQPCRRFPLTSGSQERYWYIPHG